MRDFLLHKYGLPSMCDRFDAGVANTRARAGGCH